MIVRYFKCPICGKPTPLDVLEFPDEERLFSIQEIESADRRGFPKVDEYDVLDSDGEELIAEFAEKIRYLCEEVVRLGYLTYKKGREVTLRCFV